jgi:hypothetical protein
MQGKHVIFVHYDAGRKTPVRNHALVLEAARVEDHDNHVLTLVYVTEDVTLLRHALNGLDWSECLV